MRALAFLALTACAAAAQATVIDESALRAYVEGQLAGSGRVEVTVIQSESRQVLAPCARTAPFVPSGARLWGRAMIGVSCVEGATWTVFVPVQVRIYGPALVAARALPAGKLLDADDYRIAEIEVTREPTGLLTDPADLRDRVTARSIAPGRPLRAEQLRVRPVVGAGDLVRVVHRGAGFAASTEGKALGTATAGQSVRVQTDSGRVLTGVAAPGGVVQILLGP